MSEVSNKRFVHFNGTKQDFIDGSTNDGTSYENAYANSIAFITGGDIEGGDCIYTHGKYYGESPFISGEYLGSVILPTASNTANNVGSIAIGNTCTADDAWGIATGGNTFSGGTYAVSLGLQTSALGFATKTEGLRTTATGAYSHAEGYSTNKYDMTDPDNISTSLVAFGIGSHAEGMNTITKGDYSHAEGESTRTNGLASHAEGYGTFANNMYSHAEGIETIASGDYSHAEGNNTQAQGKGSHAEGDQTTATGAYSHAEGYKTTANGSYSHAEGYESITGYAAIASSAIGLWTQTSNWGELACGMANKSISSSESINSCTLFSVGNGSGTDNRKNAFSVMSDGTAIANAYEDDLGLLPTRPVFIKYWDLIELGKNNNLVPGQKYMISDYEPVPLNYNIINTDSFIRTLFTTNNNYIIMVTALSKASLSHDAYLFSVSSYYETNDMIGIFDQNINENIDAKYYKYIGKIKYATHLDSNYAVEYGAYCNYDVYLPYNEEFDMYPGVIDLSEPSLKAGAIIKYDGNFYVLTHVTVSDCLWNDGRGSSSYMYVAYNLLRPYLYRAFSNGFVGYYNYLYSCPISKNNNNNKFSQTGSISVAGYTYNTNIYILSGLSPYYAHSVKDMYTFKMEDLLSIYQYITSIKDKRQKGAIYRVLTNTGNDIAYDYLSLLEIVCFYKNSNAAMTYHVDLKGKNIKIGDFSYNEVRLLPLNNAKSGDIFINSGYNIIRSSEQLFVVNSSFNDTASSIIINNTNLN